MAPFMRRRGGSAGSEVVEGERSEVAAAEGVRVKV